MRPGEHGGYACSGNGGRRLRCSAVSGARGRKRRRGERGSVEELTARSMSSSACSGTLGGRRIERRRSSEQTRKMATVTMLQGIRGRVLRLGASRHRGGARGHSHGARERRWPRWCSSAVLGVSGEERGRETEEGEWHRESEGGRGGRVSFVARSRRTAASRRWRATARARTCLCQ